ncbi:splicing factor 3B subunit 4-like [Tripterygium wilfordii]|uniref:splicing factor 3B subunit 4-like n=1 Tax=Tripterygium wilfordii TaxID=458696 RepID=UPI0018F84CC4|nr:splicing factor 3B subunit 4-like [Tripterygium wilfordii]
MCYVGKATKIFIFIVTVVLVLGLVFGFGLLRHGLHNKSHKCSGDYCNSPPLILPNPSPNNPSSNSPSSAQFSPPNPNPPPDPGFTPPSPTQLSPPSSSLSPPPPDTNPATPPPNSASLPPPPPPTGGTALTGAASPYSPPGPAVVSPGPVVMFTSIIPSLVRRFRDGNGMSMSGNSLSLCLDRKLLASVFGFLVG